MDMTKALKKLLNGTATEEEIRLLKQALASGEISVGGNVEGKLVIIGSGNTVEITPEKLGIIQPDIKTEEQVDGEPPYMGLHYFDTEDADLFYGRETLTLELLARVQKESFLAIVGASGSGKSSVARAGLIPAWKKENERGVVYVIKPTASPLESLAASLTRESESVTATSTLMDDLKHDSRSLRLYVKKMLGETKFLLLVDQFEETFTLCENPDERKVFIENLLSLAEDNGIARVVITLRADFYHHCLEYESLRLMLEKHQANLGAMSQDELHTAILQPAEKSDWKFEDGLMEQILQDVGSEPGALPLLSHALLETWKRRKGRKLTLQGYLDTGGVKKAITKTAEREYGKLSPAEQTIARNIFVNLTQLGEGTLDTRRRVKLDELAQANNQESISRVLKTLTDARLVTTEQDSAEVAHEALIREWGTLRKWLDEDRESLRLQRHLTKSAGEWADSGRKESYLIHRGERLDVALSLLDDPHYRDIFNEDIGVRDYLNECTAYRKREQDKQQQNKISWIIAFVALLIIAIFAVAQWNTAKIQTDLAGARSNDLKNISIASQANDLLVDHNPDKAIALALYANRGETPAGEVLASLLDVSYLSLAKNIYAVCGQSESESAWGMAVDVSRDNKTLVIGCSQNSSSAIYILDIATGQTKTEWIYPAWLYDLAISPDGRSILTGYSDGKAILWSRDGELIYSLENHTDAISTVAFSPDGTLALTGSYDKSIGLWDIVTGKLLQGLDESASYYAVGKITSVEINPKKEEVVFGDDAGNVFVWDYEYKKPYRLPRKHSNYVLDVDFSSDGVRFISSSADSTIAIWNADNLASEGILDVSEAYPGIWVKSAEYSPDNRKILAALSNGLILLWDVKTMQVVQTLEGHLAEVDKLSISSSGAFAVSGSRDGSVRVWDLGAFTNQFGFMDQKVETTSMAFTGDGTRLIGGTADGNVNIWNIGEKGLENKWSAYPSTVPVSGLALSPDQTSLLTVGGNGVAILWDMAEHTPIWQYTKDGDNARSVDISPDGTRAIIGYISGEIALLDFGTGQPTCILKGHTNVINSVRFSPNGEMAASGSNDYTVALWNISTCEKEATYFQHDGWVMAIKFSPDGKFLASASADKTIILRNLGTKQKNQLRLPEVGVNPGLDAYALSLDFSPDGYLLSAGYANGSVAIWSVTNRILLRKYISATSCQYGVHCFWVLNTEFSPTGDALWASMADGRILAWPLIPAYTPQRLKEWLEENRYIRELTEQEKVDYEIDE